MSTSAYGPCFLEYSNNRAHALAAFLTIACSNTRKHSESGEKGSYQSQRGQGEFLLSEPHGEDAKAEKRLRKSSNPRSLGAKLKDFPRREYRP